jgi:hypothetical protein
MFAIIKLFLEVPTLLESICLNCQILRKLQGSAKKQIGGNKEASCFQPIHLMNKY